MREHHSQCPFAHVAAACRATSAGGAAAFRASSAGSTALQELYGLCNPLKARHGALEAENVALRGLLAVYEQQQELDQQPFAPLPEVGCSRPPLAAACGMLHTSWHPSHICVLCLLREWRRGCDSAPGPPKVGHWSGPWTAKAGSRNLRSVQKLWASNAEYLVHCCMMRVSE
jgi:hypothetical protein